MPCREALMLPRCGCRSGLFRVRADFKIGPTDLVACPRCATATIRGGYMQVVEYWGFLTTCDEQCLTDVTIYYNTNNVGSVTVLDYITDCLATPTVNTVGIADPIYISSCATANIDTSCFMGTVQILEEVQLVGECPDQSNPILNIFYTFNQFEGTDHNGVFTIISHYFLVRSVMYPDRIEFCPPNWIMSTRKCTTCYRQVRQVDAFNVKEDYEILRGLTLGTQAYEQDFDIHILRLLKLIT
jgi:hypothetical protein